MSGVKVTGVTPATTVSELIAAAMPATTTMAATTTAKPTTTATPTTTAAPSGLSTGTVPPTYVQYPTYAGQIQGRRNDFETSAFPGGPATAADKSAPGAGTSRNSYYIATTAAKGAPSPAPGNPSGTGVMIGWPVVITGGAVPAGKIFRTRVDSYTTSNDMTWDGYRYGSYTFNPEPPAPNGPYKFFFGPTVKSGGGRRRRGSKRRGRKGTRRH